jgi:hypothetical protein
MLLCLPANIYLKIILYLANKIYNKVTETLWYDAIFCNIMNQVMRGEWMISKWLQGMSHSCMVAGNSLLHHIQNLVVFIYLLIIKFVSCIAMYPEVPDSYLMTQTCSFFDEQF